MIRKTPSCPPRRRTRTWRWATRTTSTWATPPTRTPPDRGAANAEVKAPPDADDFAPTPGMREIMVNFLVRMSFLTGESKDKQMLALHARSLSLLPRGARRRGPRRTSSSRSSRSCWRRRRRRAATPHPAHGSGGVQRGRSTPTLSASSPGTRRSSAQMLEPCFGYNRSRATHEALANLSGSRAPCTRCRPRTRRPASAACPPPRPSCCSTGWTSSVPSTSPPPCRRRGGRRRHPQRADPGHERGVRADVHLRARGAEPAWWTATFRTSSSCCPGSRTS